MFRDFGPTHQNHSPIGGYESPTTPHIREQGGYHPPVTFTSRQLRRAGILVLEPETEVADLQPSMDEFEAEFDLANEMLGNMDLPISSKRGEIQQSIKENRVTILVAPTGSGKTIETPKMVLELGMNSVVTQPRILSTNLISEYLQTQLRDKIGAERARGMVGILNSQGSTLSDNTNTAFITDGIAARPQALNKLLNKKTVFMPDEIHERNKNMDLALGFDTKRIKDDPSARTVLMSATVDAGFYADFYEKHTGIRPNIIEVDGRVQPIEDRVEPDSDVVEQAIKCVGEGDRTIAVILPGKQEINDTIDAIRRQLPPDYEGKVTIVPLHANQTKQEQDMATRQMEDIKIICATNVMESSVTIPGLSAVIDAGYVRRVYLDSDGREALRIVPASQAEMMQRRGRTGRDVAGKYIHTRMNRSSTFIPKEARPEYPEPEMLRTNIDSVVLRLAAEGEDIDTFPLPSMPSAIVRRQSKRALRDLGALDEEGKITKLGLRMEKFPVRPSSARMLLEALPFNSHIRSQMAAIVATLEAGSLADHGDNAKSDWKDLTSQIDSDLFAQLDLFVKSQGKSNYELRKLGLDVKNVRRAQTIYGKLVQQTDAWDGELGPLRDEHKELLVQAIAAGMVSRVYKHVGDGIYELMGGHAESIPRELSNRSVVKGFPAYLLGDPYTIEFWRDGDLTEKAILEHVTTLDDVRVLGRVAASHLLSWREVNRSFRGRGQLRIVQRQVFNGCITLPETREVDAAASPENTAYMSTHILENAGPAQLKLREIKKDLEELQRLTHIRLPLITQDDLLGLLGEAMADGNMDESYIDNRLREIMLERNITLDGILSAEDQDKIRAASPETIVVNGHKLTLNYHYEGSRSGIPVITNASGKFIEVAPDDLRLPDGRRVFVWQERRRKTLSEVRWEHAELFTQ